MPGVVRFLSLRKRLLNTADDPDVLVDGDAEGEGVLLRLAVVELLNPNLKVREGFQWGGEIPGELDCREGAEGGSKVACCV